MHLLQDTDTKKLVSEKNKTSDTQPIYQKPKTALFLEKATEIKGGADGVLESQAGDNFLTS